MKGPLNGPTIAIASLIVFCGLAFAALVMPERVYVRPEVEAQIHATMTLTGSFDFPTAITVFQAPTATLTPWPTADNMATNTPQPPPCSSGMPGLCIEVTPKPTKEPTATPAPYPGHGMATPGNLYVNP